jgi:hypothetical protein
VTVTEPAEVKVQERVAVPEPPVTVAGDMAHAELSDARATSPTKPFNGEMVIVEVPAEFTATVTAVGLAAMAKSARLVTA